MDPKFPDYNNHSFGEFPDNGYGTPNFAQYNTPAYNNPQYEYQPPATTAKALPPNLNQGYNPMVPPMPTTSGGMGGGMGAPGGSQFDPNMSFNNIVNQVTSNPMASMGLQYGQAYVKQNFGGLYRWLGADTLKYYFHVDNVYVLTKLKLILVPCLHKDWSRKQTGMQQQGLPEISKQWSTPRNDVNAPDLYIPAMAFLTFTLLMGYVLGTFGHFTPEVLGMTASSIFFVLVVEILMLKMGFYLIGTNISSPRILDLVAYCSYKYAPMIVMTLSCLFLGSTVFYVSVLVLGISIGIFMMKTLRREIDEGTSSQGQPRDTGVKTNYFLFMMGILQLLFSYFLVRTVNNAPAILTKALSGIPPTVALSGVKAALDASGAPPVLTPPPPL